MASDLRITIPKNVGVHLTYDGSASSLHVEAMKQVNEHGYEMDQYLSATKKIEMIVEVGASHVIIDQQ